MCFSALVFLKQRLKTRILVLETLYVRIYKVFPYWEGHLGDIRRKDAGLMAFQFGPLNVINVRIGRGLPHWGVVQSGLRNGLWG